MSRFRHIGCNMVHDAENEDCFGCKRGGLFRVFRHMHGCEGVMPKKEYYFRHGNVNG